MCALRAHPYLIALQLSRGIRAQPTLANMRIAATGDILDARLEMLARDLSEVMAADVDEARTFLRSADPASWIALVDHLPTWAVVLGPSAALFLNELLKEAAKDAYKNKAVIGRALAKPLVRSIRIVASAIAKFRKTGGGTQVDIGAPIPDEYFGTRLRLAGEDESAIALELALFVVHCDGIQPVLDTMRHGGSGVIGQVTLTLLAGGGMRIQWMDRDAEVHTEILPPPAP